MSQPDNDTPNSGQLASDMSKLLHTIKVILAVLIVGWTATFWIANMQHRIEVIEKEIINQKQFQMETTKILESIKLELQKISYESKRSP